eukprot:3283324-Rhodomonas_salina.1
MPKKERLRRSKGHCAATLDETTNHKPPIRYSNPKQERQAEVEETISNAVPDKSRDNAQQDGTRATMDCGENGRSSSLNFALSVEARSLRVTGAGAGLGFTIEIVEVEGKVGRSRDPHDRNRIEVELELQIIKLELLQCDPGMHFLAMHEKFPRSGSRLPRCAPFSACELVDVQC